MGTTPEARYAMHPQDRRATAADLAAITFYCGARRLATSCESLLTEAADMVERANIPDRVKTVAVATLFTCVFMPIGVTLLVGEDFLLGRMGLCKEKIN